MAFNPLHNRYIAKCDEFGEWIINEARAKDLKGHWREFLKKEILTVEIGPGNGWFMIDYLKLHPDEAFIAIEKRYKRSVKCAEKLKRANIENGRIIRGEGELLGTYFEKKEIDRIIINFPTPWVKERHKKHILFSDAFVTQLNDILSSSGEVFLKSDHTEYMTIAAEKLKEHSFVLGLDKEKYEYVLSRNKNIKLNSTGYEEQWKKEGREIFSLHATRS